jgi:hypothetical protein
LASTLTRTYNLFRRLDESSGKMILQAGLGIFWTCAALDLIGLRFISGGISLVQGVIAIISLSSATIGFAIYKKSLFEALTLFLPINLICFECLLLSIPWDQKWFFRYASVFVDVLGLGKIVTNFFLLLMSSFLLVLNVFRKVALS